MIPSIKWVPRIVDHEHIKQFESKVNTNGYKQFNVTPITVNVSYLDRGLTRVN